jgi:hypothetical protein
MGAVALYVGLVTAWAVVTGRTAYGLLVLRRLAPANAARA